MHFLKDKNYNGKVGVGVNRSPHFIGIDIGTQGTKVSLVNASGEMVTNSFIPSNLIRPEPGTVEQQPSEMLLAVIDGIREVKERSRIDPRYILAIGLDGQMAGIMGIDRDWNAVTSYDSWLDTRCEKYMPMMKEQEEQIIQLTGSPVTYAHGPKILWWKHERPDVYKRIDKFILPTTYVAGSLAGLKAEQAFIDYTHLHFAGFGDVLRNRWSDELLHAFDISKDKLPRIVNPWDIIGHLTKENAKLCGLAEGTPIIAGCGDTAATILGAGITKAGSILDVAGTASVLSCCVNEYQPDTRTKTFIYARSVIPDLWTPLAYINGGGQCLAWFRDMMAMKEGKVTFDELNTGAARESAGSKGLYFIPHFAGRVCPNNPFLRGSWLGLNWSHHQAHMYRSILESIAYEYHGYLAVIRQLIPDARFTNVNVVGGGAKGDLFNSIKADVLNVPYTTLNNSDTATVASAVIAGYGIGFYTDIAETMNSIVKVKRKIEPNADNHKLYTPLAETYQRALEALTPIYRNHLS
ncbi:FGGY-family carbohydrate kinase [Paenibacillus abyssi]|uniref:xylulokinase n=1 Tax=Paenibacillus abyssi TaxID=1340531 RepID=UPI0036224239